MRLACQHCNQESFAYAYLHNYTVDVGYGDLTGLLFASVNDEETNRECARKRPPTAEDLGRILKQDTWHCGYCGEEDSVVKHE